MSILKTEVEIRFRKSVESYEENASIQKEIVAHLCALAAQYCPSKLSTVLEVGCGTGLLTERLCKQLPDAEIWLNDLVNDMCVKAASRCHISYENCMPGDIETLELGRHFDLIVSASTFQWLEQPAHTLLRLSEKLNSGGWLVFSTFGPSNCMEIKDITGEGLTYYSMSQIQQMLPDNLEVIHCEEGRSELLFEAAIDVLKHIKKTGVNASESRQVWTKRHLDKFQSEYKQRFQKNGRYPLTYHPQYFICRRK